MSIGQQLLWLMVLAMPVAAVCWTVVHEEVLHEPREYALHMSQSARSLAVRKFFYMLTCEYCLSHYVVIFFLAITRYKLLYDDWRGYLVAGLTLVWVANIYMGIYGRVKLGVKKERAEIKAIEKEVERSDKAA
ncbi:MAG TPA: hypothetical protein VGQ71_03370 [Terriglobales bacterium]|jgi:hypothetical protein|nr:hypothetical protein [Terriglobales bacterium]